MTTSTLSGEQLAVTQKKRAKLPLLKPAVWLFARDSQRQFTFLVGPQGQLVLKELNGHG